MWIRLSYFQLILFASRVISFQFSVIPQVSLLEELRDIAAENNLGAGLQVKVRFNINAALFDYNPVVSSCMRPEAWAQ